MKVCCWTTAWLAEMMDVLRKKLPVTEMIRRLAEIGGKELSSGKNVKVVSVQEVSI